MNLDKEIKKKMIEVGRLTPCYCLIYKTTRGNYRVCYLSNKEEEQEIKSIIADKFAFEVDDE